MNQIVVFGLILFFLTRIIGFMISLDFYLKTKQFKFKIATIGWLLWGVAAVFPILTFNTLISAADLIKFIREI